MARYGRRGEILGEGEILLDIPKSNIWWVSPCFKMAALSLLQAEKQLKVHANFNNGHNKKKS